MRAPNSIRKHIDKNLLVAMNRKGLSLSEMADFFNVTRQTISRRLSYYNIKHESVKMKKLESFIKKGLVDGGKSLCACGCGGVPNIAKYSRSNYRVIKGQRLTYIQGHHVKHQHSKRSPMDRFLEKIKIRKSGCWEWIRFVGNHGYGMMRFRGGPWVAPRVSWVLYKGEIPNGKFVLHHCDNRLCVNPQHLFLGNQSDNMRDMVRKGRGNCVFGEGHPLAKYSKKLLSKIVKESRAGASGRSLSRKYGINAGYLYTILAGRNRKGDVVL